MNIEELFTLSGTGLVIGALLSWLSLAFTARRVPASAAQTQPNSRQPLSSGGKALRVFSLAAALLGEDHLPQRRFLQLASAGDFLIGGVGTCGR